MYDLGVVGTGMFFNDVHRWFKTAILHQEDPYMKVSEVNDRSKSGNSKYVWALKDITFDVEEGDVVGIIGKNGAGKSTLLKLLSRVTGPTTGTIKAKGRIASLLEVGTGFHPELTGRENIYMNGAILGMTKAEIKSKLDEIIDFSGCERYIDTPVKRYSSGMMVRLGFAVAAHLEPEILVVDEVLAVGDAEFQKKAIGKMKDVSKGDGRTVLFVSHNMTSMQRLCKNGILFDNGQIVYRGDIADTIHKYLSNQLIINEYRCENVLTQKICLLKGHVYSESGNKITPSTPVIVDFIVAINAYVEHLVLGFNLVSSFEHPIARVDYNENSERHTLPPGVYKFRYKIPSNTLAEGEYRIVFDTAEHKVKNYAPEGSTLTFTVETGNSENNPYYDNIPTKHSIIHENWFLDSEKLD
jgi:lipopolysaccharide transport system ATP-binding protein